MGAISHLYYMIDRCLGLQENTVAKFGFSCKCVFYRPDDPDPQFFETKNLQKYSYEMRENTFQSCFLTRITSKQVVLLIKLQNIQIR